MHARMHARFNQILCVSTRRTKPQFVSEQRIHWEQQGMLVCETGGGTMSLRHQARWIIDPSPSRAKNCSLANLCTPCTEWGNGKSDQLSTWGKESLNPGPGVANYNYINVCDDSIGEGRGGGYFQHEWDDTPVNDRATSYLGQRAGAFRNYTRKASGFNE